MITLEKRYRSNYTGENIITLRVQKNQSWTNTLEFVPNSVINNHVSTNAVAIGNGLSRDQFNLNLLKDHKAGLLGANSLQTYGANTVYRTFNPDFLVVVGDPMAQEVINAEYTTGHIVFSTSREVVQNPGKFYLVPYDPNYNAGALAVYLACFDGHKTIYMLGFDGQETGGYEDNVYATQNWPGYDGNTTSGAGNFPELVMQHIMQVYDDVTFVRVMPSKYASIPEAWKYQTNFKQIDFREFVLAADL